MGNFHATTIFAVHHNGECAMAGDGKGDDGECCCNETYSS